MEEAGIGPEKGVHDSLHEVEVANSRMRSRAEEYSKELAQRILRETDLHLKIEYRKYP